MKQAIYDLDRLQVCDDGVREFFWPLDRQEVMNVRDKFLAELIPWLRSTSQASKHAQVLSLLAHILGEVLSAYQAQALIRRARNCGRDPAFSPKAVLSNALLSGRMPEHFPTVSLLRRGLVRDPSWKPWARSVRSFVKQDVVKSAAFSGVNLSRDVVTIATGEMISQHAEAVGGVRYLALGNWFEHQGSETKSFAGPVPAAFLDSVVDIVRTAFTVGDEPLEDCSAQYLRAWLSEAMNLTDRYLGSLLATPKRIPKNLWRGAGGLIWGRLLSFACRELGGTVTGHDHSTGQGAWASYSDTILELPFCDRFMVWTPTQRDMAVRNLRRDLCLPGEPPQILPVPGDFKPKIAGRSTTNASPRSSGKPVAMYVGTLYVDDFVPFTPLHPAPVLADWEARLFRKLHDWGYEVLLKPHPESRNRLPQTYLDALGVRVFNERFEDVYALADVLLFGQTNSSTFFGALGTDSPIVLANEPLNPWQPEARSLAAERCVFADTRPGDDNRLETDWTRLQAELGRAGALKSQNFYRQYFLQ